MSSYVMGEWLVDSLLVTTLLMGVILLVRRRVAKIFGPNVAYALWLIPAARLLMPSLESKAAPAIDSSHAVRDAVHQAMLASVPSSDTIIDTASKSVVASVDLTALGVTFWLGGAALFFIIQMIRYASMRDDLLSEATQIGRIDGVSVVASDHVAGPLAFGLFKRYIAVPQDFTKTFSPAERELAIAHEMAHHKSGDLFANLAAFIILCLQWFNPVAWMSWNAFRFDQEAACDARVLAGKGAEERAIYGQALARTAFDGVPTFATALNSPKTVIERLRRLTMKDASTRRRLFGKLGVISAAALILPLTATVVPAINAQDNPVPPAVEEAMPEAVKKVVKIIKINKDGKTVHGAGNTETKVIKKIMRDGKTMIVHGDHEFSDTQLKKISADAEKSAADAEKWAEHADKMRENVDEIRQSAEIARGNAEVMRVHAISMVANYIPEIDIREISKNCKQGQPVTTNVEGFDGTNKSRIRLVMCGKGQARIAQVEAIKGLREARSEIGNDKEIPEGVRKDVIEKLEQQIRRLEAQAEKAN